MTIRTNPIVKYFYEAIEELKKVTWPSRKTLLNHTVLVIGVSLVLALFLGAIDLGLTSGLQLILNK